MSNKRKYTVSDLSKAAHRSNMAKANSARREKNKAVVEARRLHPGAYKSWRAMKTRCNNPNHNRYKFYGGRGISYDPKWENFLGFVEDMGERPEGLTLDRVDVDGSYSAENCRWATYSQQNSNRRRMDSGETDHIPRVF